MTQKSVLVIPFSAHGHIPGFCKIVEDLLSLGFKATCLLTEEFEKRFKDIGVNTEVYKLDMSEAPKTSSRDEFAKFVFPKLTELFLSMSDKFKGKYDYLIIDSFFDGFEINKLYKIPKVITLFNCFSNLDPVAKEICMKTNLETFIALNKKYNLELRHYLINLIYPKTKYNLILTSKEFHPKTPYINDTYYFIGPVIEKRAIDKSFTFKKEPNKKLIYISLGTLNFSNIDFFKICIKAFKTYNDYQIIISIGNHFKKESLGEIPDNCLIYNYVPQLQVLEQADIFITHGGINSIYEAFILYELPLIIVPQEIDQQENADIIKEYNASIVLDNETFNSEKLIEAVNTMIKEKDKFKVGVKKIVDTFNKAIESRKKILEKIFV